MIFSTTMLAETNIKQTLRDVIEQNNCHEKDITLLDDNNDLTIINNAPEVCHLDSQHLFFVGLLLGTHFLNTTHTAGISSQFLKVNKHNKMLYNITLDYETNRLLRPQAMDYFQDLNLGINYHIFKSPFFIGPSIQVLKLSNKAIAENGSQVTLAGLLGNLGFQKLFLKDKLLVGVKFNYGVIKYFDELRNASGLQVQVAWKLSK